MGAVNFSELIRYSTFYFGDESVLSIRIKTMKKSITNYVITLPGLVYMALLLCSTGAHGNQAPRVEEPRVPFQFAYGKKKYQDMCSRCHGDWGEGSGQGPPLMHRFYKPSRSNDNAFYRAAIYGVRGHHWNFGDMPPVPGITKPDLDVIVPFLRWLQKENGIY